MSKTKALFNTEDVNFGFIEEEIEGIFLELSKPEEHIHQGYIDEKCENIIRFFTGTVKNFQRRSQYSEVRKKFLLLVERLEGEQQ